MVGNNVLDKLEGSTSMEHKRSFYAVFFLAGGWHQT